MTLLTFQAKLKTDMKRTNTAVESQTLALANLFEFLQLLDDAKYEHLDYPKEYDLLEQVETDYSQLLGVFKEFLKSNRKCEEEIVYVAALEMQVTCRRMLKDMYKTCSMLIKEIKLI